MGNVAGLLARRSPIHFGLLKFSRTLPLKMLPPLLVMTLITPPEKRPYSAEMPPVRMLVSDGVFDVEAVGGAKQVVVDVDAVHHEDIVECRRARNRELAGVRGVAGQARREIGNLVRRAADRQRVDFSLAVGLADRRHRQLRRLRRVAGDRHCFRDRPSAMVCGDVNRAADVQFDVVLFRAS